MGPVLGILDPYLGIRTYLCTQKLAQYRWDIQYVLNIFLFMGLKSVVYNREQFQIKSGL